jgi:hypothetical protein
VKKSDLKDGMVLTYRDGSERYLLDGLIYCKSSSCKVYTFYKVNELESYRDDLVFKSHQDPGLDIVKVEYMGEVLWSRPIYVKLDAKTAMRVLVVHGEVPCKKYEDSDSLSDDTLVGVMMGHNVGSISLQDEFITKASDTLKECWVDKKLVDELP